MPNGPAGVGRSFWQEAEYSIEKKKRRREEGRRKGKREKERTKLRFGRGMFQLYAYRIDFSYKLHQFMLFLMFV